MDDPNENKKFSLQVGTPKCGLVTGIIGAVFALLLIFVGFWNTIFVALLFAIGYFLGAYQNKAATLKSIINKIFPPKDQSI
ncbi:MAG: DUF2273 domain-containing protein [Clostridia bacterium]